jgi:hypothetical protein
MKITKQQLKRIIKEELENVLEGQSNDMAQYGLQGPGDWGTGGLEHPSPNEQGAAYDGTNDAQIEAVLNQYAPSENNPNGDYELAARILADDGIDRDEVNNYSQKLFPNEAMVKYAQNVARELPEGNHPGYHEY